MADRGLIRMQTIDSILGASSIIGNMAIIAATFQMEFSAECSTDANVFYHTKVTLSKATWTWQFEFDSSESRVRICHLNEASKDAYLTGSGEGWLTIKNIFLVNQRGEYNLQFIVGILLFLGTKEILLDWNDDYNLLSKDSAQMLMSRTDAEQYLSNLEDAMVCILSGRKDKLQDHLGSIAFITLFKNLNSLELDAASSVK
jgi:hypothetical protein